jgi:predicted metal-dependent phosphotriesterase family hydrolase
MSAVIRTIGGDLPAELAGPTYVHEHLFIDSPLVAETMPHIHLHSVDEAVAEVQTCVAAGVRTMVDAMPAASGRDPERLSRVSVFTGMRVVAATGLHTAKYYEDVPWTREETPEQLAARFVADIEEGIDQHDYRGETVDRTGIKAGLVKAGALTESLSGRDERLFEAAAITHEATGAPILTHAEGGLGGPGQVARLLAHGVAAQHIALSHTDKAPDPGYHREMLETGVFLCYDQGIRDPETTLRLIDEMIEAGFGGQIVLGTDGARRSLWSTLGGGPGLAALYQLVSEALDAETSDILFVANPARFLTLGR